MAEANPYDQFEPNPYDSFDSNKETPKPSAEEPSFLERTGKFLKQATRFSPPAIALKIAGKSGELADKAAYEAGGKVTDVTGSPEAGFATNVALQSIPAMFGSGPAKAGEIALKDIVKGATLKAAKEEGYVVPPSATGSGHLERLVESIGGRADIAREASTRNQQITNKIARREAGLAENEPITEATLGQARERIAEPYRQISDISPQAAKALENLKQTRAESKVYWRHYNMQGDPKSLAQAQKLDTKAESLETRISSIAGEVSPDLLPALKEARIALAKNHDIEKALNLGSGDVDAKIIGRMLDKRGTNAMTGGLQTIGKFAEAYGPYAKSNVGPTDVNKLTPYAALLLGGAGYEGTQYMSGHPYGAAMGALPFLAPGARGLALSKLLQSGEPIGGQGFQRAVQAGAVPLSKLGE